MATTIATEKPTWAMRRIRLRRALAGGWSVGVAVIRTHPGPGVAARRHPAAATGGRGGAPGPRAGSWLPQPASSARPDDLVSWPLPCQGHCIRRRATGHAPGTALLHLAPRCGWPGETRRRLPPR